MNSDKLIFFKIVSTKKFLHIIFRNIWDQRGPTNDKLIFFKQTTISFNKKVFTHYFSQYLGPTGTNKHFFSSCQRNKPDSIQFSSAKTVYSLFKAVFFREIRNCVEPTRLSTKILTQIDSNLSQQKIDLIY